MEMHSLEELPIDQQSCFLIDQKSKVRRCAKLCLQLLAQFFQPAWHRLYVIEDLYLNRKPLSVADHQNIGLRSHSRRNTFVSTVAFLQ